MGSQAATVAGNIGYRADGQPTTFSYGNGIQETRSYDADGRLDCQQIGSAASQCLDYDANGNLLNNPTANASYHYDALDRLDQQTVDSISQSYGYDANRNRLSRSQGTSTESYRYAITSNRLVQRAGQSLGLDVNGNATSDGSDAYRYNRRGQLNRFYRNGQQLAAYTVNALGQRALKTLTSGKIVYQYGLQGELLAEITKDAQGSWTAFDYVWNPQNQNPIARFKTSIPAGGTASTQDSLILHTDPLGSPIQASDAQGRTVWTWRSDAFGTAAPNQDPDGDGVLTQINLRIPGQYYDAETGLHYNWQRYYQPKTRRYISSDPIGLLGGINTYTYVLNNPLRYIDPLGLESTVYVWQPVGWGGSSFGHVSADINGTTYSYGPSGMTILPTSDYLSKNSFRDGTGVTLNINSQQEKSLQACLSKPQGDYSALTNNCGTPVQSCLKDQGIDTGNQTLPVSLGNKLLDMGIVNGVRNSPATTPANGSSAPWAR